MIIPAIDILSGHLVRLFQGDFERSTQYRESPLDRLRAYQAAGAERIHLVDLSRAKCPEEGPSECIQTLIRNADLPIQVGGGLRSREDIEFWLNAGASKVVVGLAAISQPKVFESWIRALGADVFVLALDVHPAESETYTVAINGWTADTNLDLFERVSFFRSLGIKEILCTDISRDGMLEGPNINLYSALANTFPNIYFQASGGVSCLEDILALKDTGVNAAILGKSLIEGNIKIKEALACWSEKDGGIFDVS